MSALHVVVGLCTCNRSHLLDGAIKSVYAQANVSARVTLLIVDNSADANANAQVDELAAEKPACVERVIYVHESQRGIPFARNRVVEEALRMDADFVALFDDDAEADPAWLASLLQVQDATKADVVTGPQDPVFPERAPRWAVACGAYESRNLPEGARVGWAATNNVLVGLSFVKKHNLRFDPMLAFSGGSDQMFFMEAAQYGANMVWTNTAITREEVPYARLTVGWLLRRNFRYSSQGVYFLRKLHGVAKGSVLAFARGGYYLLLALFYGATSVVQGKKSLVNAVCMLSRAAGWWSGLVGVRHKEYTPR